MMILQILFDDSSDEGEDNEDNYDEMFALKTQFEGEKGMKVRLACYDDVIFILVVVVVDSVVRNDVCCQGATCLHLIGCLYSY